jgi:hypothetical protein
MNSKTNLAGKIGAILVALVVGIASIASAKGQADPPRPYRFQGMYGSGMMSGGMMSGGMMGGAPWWDGNGLPGSSWQRTVDIKKAEQLVAEYLNRLGAKNLKIEEIMEFEYNLYALIVETDTDKAAFELLVDPFTGAIRPEFGPNMMWNTKYGMMGSGVGAASGNTISEEQAVKIAADYLSRVRGGGPYEIHGDEFYGYFTFDYQKGGQILGMLSVNSFTGQVWYHGWHGGFLGEEEMTM